MTFLPSKDDISVFYQFNYTILMDMSINWKKYVSDKSYDEYVTNDHLLRREAKIISKILDKYSIKQLEQIEKNCQNTISSRGINFKVYSAEKNAAEDKKWPLDIIPRIILKSKWNKVKKGLAQRTKALNLFINDVYNQKKIFKDKVVPENIVFQSKHYLKQCEGFSPKRKVWSHISGIDLIRNIDGNFLVLEDNLRVPSGVSYMLENRMVMREVFPELFTRYRVSPIGHYCNRLYHCMIDAIPYKTSSPTMVLLTPGVYNSAYFEHSFLAQQMGITLVEGKDLYVEDDKVYMKTVKGGVRVDCIYRRLDDTYLDPKTFYKKSLIGVPGLFKAYYKNNVAIINAPGSGVADDKVIYSYVPQMIEYYLGEKPKINQVETFLLTDSFQLDHVVQNIHKMVVKPADGSGGYGIMIGPKASKEEREVCVNKIKKEPRNFIAQPLENLSTTPTMQGTEIEPRHQDLRPFILSGKETYITAGGLTRVALKKGSTIVNSSQGGGSKDTIIIDM
jgi:uncharacterized circularly permuted ATP-grasp superfamily protein